VRGRGVRRCARDLPPSLGRGSRPGRTGAGRQNRVAPKPRGAAGRHPRRRGRRLGQRGLFVASVAASLCDVLPLSESYEATLAGLGRRTRRNVRLARRTAASRGISFSMALGGSQVPRPELRGLVARTRPSPHSPSRVGRFERYVASTGGGFHSCLRDLRGQLISHCRGFLHERTAYLVYQLNDAAWHPLSPSLLHRAHLIEALIGLGVHELIFVHGCGGLLCHACHPMPVDQIWVMRPRLPARLLTRAVAAATPGTAYRQLALQALQGSAATWEDTWR
jgi:hypothetical protein